MTATSPDASPSSEAESRTAPETRGALALPFATALLLLMGATPALISANPFWLSASVWAAIILSVPWMLGRDRGRVPAWWLALPLFAFYAPAAALSLSGADPYQMDSPLFIILGGAALFCLCLGTMLVIASYSSVKMNAGFAAIFTLVLFVAMVAIQGPIAYYGDALLGVVRPLDNTEFMRFVVLSSAIGLILTLAALVEMRRTGFVRVLTGSVGSRRGA